MKNLITILTLIALIVFFSSCKKDDENPSDELETVNENFTALNDTFVGGFKYYSGGYYNYDLDIDKDLVVDLTIEVSMHFSGTYGSEFNIKLSPKNGFEMAIDSTTYSRWSWNPTLIDTLYTTHAVQVPNVIDAGSLIPGSLIFNNSPCYLYFYKSPGGIGYNYTNTYSYKIASSDFVYLAFRKETDSTPILAWLKLKFIEDDMFQNLGVILNSCSYSDDIEELVVK